MNYIENYTLSLELGHTYIKNRFDVVIQLFSVENVMQVRILDFSGLLQLFTGGLFLVLLLLGSYFRYLLYEQCFHQYQGKEFKPINILILFVTISQHLTMVSHFMLYSFTVLSENLFGHVKENRFCTFVYYLYRFDIVYAIVGGLVISVYRILYIKCENLVKYEIGEKVLLCAILAVGLITPLCVALFLLKDYDDGIIDSCLLVPRGQMLDLLDEYAQSLGRTPLKENFEIFVALTSLIGIFITVIEIFIYICFFHHVYKHENKERILQLLDKETIKRRNDKNAISFLGQFCSFTIEISGMIIMFVCTKNKFLLPLIPCVRVIGFTLMALLDVLTSSQLRLRFVQRW